MPVTLETGPVSDARPVHCVARGALEAAGLDAPALEWARANRFEGAAGDVLVLPGDGGAIAGALFGTGDGMAGGYGALGFGALAGKLPEEKPRLIRTAGAEPYDCMIGEKLWLQRRELFWGDDNRTRTSVDAPLLKVL